VKAIIDALDAHESRIVRMPFYTHAARVLGTGLGVMPRWLGDWVQRVSYTVH
jgi:hypothetical protein